MELLETGDAELDDSDSLDTHWRAEAEALQTSLREIRAKQELLARSAPAKLGAYAAEGALPTKSTVQSARERRRSVCQSLVAPLSARSSTSSRLAAQELRADNAAAEFSKVSKRQLAEVKKMQKPPVAVRRALEAALLLLRCERVEASGGPRAELADASRAWGNCTQMLANDEFVGSILGFEARRLDATPRVARHLLVSLLGLGDDAVALALGQRLPSAAGTSGGALSKAPIAKSLLEASPRRLSRYGTASSKLLAPQLIDADVVSRAHGPCGALIRWIHSLLATYCRERLGAESDCASNLEAQYAAAEARLQRVMCPPQPSPEQPLRLSVGHDGALHLPIILSRAPSVMGSRPGTRMQHRPGTSMLVAPPEPPRDKVRWTDPLDCRPQPGLHIAGFRGWQASGGRYKKTERVVRVVLELEEPPEAAARLLAAVRVPFSRSCGDVIEAASEQLAGLRRLASLLQPQQQWYPKVRLEGRREPTEAEGLGADRALAAYRWLTFFGRVEPGALRLRAANKAMSADRCVAVRPLRELVALSGPQHEHSCTLPPGLFFEASKADLTPATSAVAQEMARWLFAEEGYSVALEGHVDAAEKDVSLQRAMAVRDVLVFHGVCSQRIHVQTCRAWHPLARHSPNHNRRVEVHLF